jgi:hypothetical protein
LGITAFFLGGTGGNRDPLHRNLVVFQNLRHRSRGRARRQNVIHEEYGLLG